MKAVDTNVLVHAHREDSPFHDRAFAAVAARAEGPLVHDARVAALCMHNGVDELLSADRDFGRFPGLVVRNPLVAPGDATPAP